MISKKILDITFIMLGMVMMSDSRAVTDTSEFKKPYYTLQLSYAGTGAEFRVNDIPVYQENSTGQVDLELPVSDKMIFGKNEVKIIAFPPIENGVYLHDWPHADAHVEAILYVREKGEEKNTRKMLTQISLYPAKDIKNSASANVPIVGQDLPVIDDQTKPRQFPDIKFEKQIVISRKTHPIKTPFPRWEWQDGQTINDTKENYDSLLNAYRKEYVVHQHKDLTATKENSRKLAQIQKIINYYDNLDQAYETLNLEESWKSEEQELFRFIEGDFAIKQGMKLDIVANGKLARIVNDGGVQPILYIVKSARIKVIYKYLFYKNKNGEWIYIM